MTPVSLGLDTFGDVTVGPNGQPQAMDVTLREVLDQATLADEIGIDFIQELRVRHFLGGLADIRRESLHHRHQQEADDHEDNDVFHQIIHIFSLSFACSQRVNFV